MSDISKHLTTDPSPDYGDYTVTGIENKPFTDGELEVIALQMKQIEHWRDRVGGARTGGRKANLWKKALHLEERRVYVTIVHDHGVEEVTLLDGRRLVIEKVFDAEGRVTKEKPVFR